MEGFRQARIVERLAEGDAWDVAACQRLQVDVESVAWRSLRPCLLALEPGDEDARLGLELLAAWDGRVAVESAAASVYELWIAEMSERIARAKAPSAWRWAIGAGFGDLVPLTSLHTAAPGRLIGLLREEPEGWFPDGWAAQSAAALSAAVRRLRAEHGPDPVAWGWGRLRTLTLRHPVGEQPMLADAFNLGPVPFPGDCTTPLQAASGPLDPFANPGFLPNMRAVIDLADPDAGRWSLAGGQSGNPCSRHYRDLFNVWLHGDGVPIPFTPAAVEAATVATLELLPED
jgi:penicillin amidase